MRESFRLTEGRFLLILSVVLVILIPSWMLQGSIEQLHDSSPVYSGALGVLAGFIQLALTLAAYRIFLLGPERELA
ncbi:MAG: hypothetical protein GAK43_02565 [Stenotrophomonas maltophilia]|nr:MAG: hypothetical protein GAK43_02565 [Stenotrophomonas maltophilia]